MPNITLSNYPWSDGRRQYRVLAETIRDACIAAHEPVPELGKWKPSDVVVTLLGHNIFGDDSPVQIVVDVLYQKPERTPEVLQRFGRHLIEAAKTVYPRQKFEVTFRPLIDPAYVVCSE